MSYIVPQVQVFQEFQNTPAAITNPLRALIVGPNYFAQKYADGEGLLGQYDPDADAAFNWPSRPVGAVVDQDFTQVNVKDALLRYYANAVGSSADEVVGVYGQPNRIRAEAVNFKANGTLYPRSTSLPARDVAVGDIARVYAAVGDTTHEVWSKVVDIVADVSDPIVAASGTADADNSSDMSAGVDDGAGGNITNTGTGGGSRSITAVVGDGGYDGIADGYPAEIYTVEVTTASSGAYAGGLATVTSASGTDNATDVALSVSSTTIGSRGLTVAWAGSGQFNVGDKFVIHVRMAYTAPTMSGSGTFNSDTDTTYIVEVTRGGTADGGTGSGTAQISVSTTNGLDVSGPHFASSDTDISIGTKGVTIQLSIGGGNAELPLGYKWYLACTGRTSMGYKTLVLADNIPSALRPVIDGTGGSSSSSSAVAWTDLNLQLFVKKDITLPRENYPDAPAVNWSQTATQITLESGAKIYDSDFVDSLGDYVELVLDADSDGLYSIAYVTYRALLQTYASDIQTIDDIADVTTMLGEVSADNPLALAVWYALRNSNGTAVKFMAVPTNDLTGYNDVLDKATGRRDFYTIVPTTRDATILNAVAAHVDQSSDEEAAQWRIAFFNGLSSATASLIDVGQTYPSGGTGAYVADDLLATVADDPDTAGTQYTIVTWDDTAYPAGGGFVDMGVRAGDLFRTNYTGDGFGGTTYDDYVVDAVLSNQQLRLSTGPSAAISVAQKFSVQRSMTKTEEATAYGLKTASYTSRRIYFVWPDLIENAAGTRIDGYYLCAAIAGLISGVVPQQGLTNVAIEGFSAATRTTDYFSESQLNVMAESGIWIVSQDPDSGTIYTRHQVSTDMTDVNTRELSVTKDVDAISYIYYDQLKSSIGQANVTPRFLTQLRRQIMGATDYMKSSGATQALGGMLIEATIENLRQHATLLDTVVVELELEIPYPVNNIQLKLVI